MKNIAVLISGEYRSFDSCLPTMGQLLTSTHTYNIDVFFCTWSESHQVHPLDNTLSEHISNITKEKIYEKLKLYQVAGVVVLEFDTTKLWKFNEPMCKLWEIGLKMIRETNKQYEYLVILRPDLYFHPSTLIDWDSINPTKLYSAWHHHDAPKANEVVFIGKFDIVASCLPSVNEWTQVRPEYDWHLFLFNFIKEAGVTLEYLEPRVSVLMARPPYNLIVDYDSMLNNFEKWKKKIIDFQKNEYGLTRLIEIWGLDYIKQLYPECFLKKNSSSYKWRI
jgi:hypothetical protein